MEAGEGGTMGERVREDQARSLLDDLVQKEGGHRDCAQRIKVAEPRRVQRHALVIGA